MWAEKVILNYGTCSPSGMHTIVEIFLSLNNGFSDQYCEYLSLNVSYKLVLKFFIKL